VKYRIALDSISIFSKTRVIAWEVKDPPDSFRKNKMRILKKLKKKKKNRKMMTRY